MEKRSILSIFLQLAKYRHIQYKTYNGIQQAEHDYLRSIITEAFSIEKMDAAWKKATEEMEKENAALVD